MAKRKILIIDDEESFARMVKLNLEAAGDFEVRTESRGLLAIPVIKEFKPEMIFLDIIMPDLSGVDIFAELKNDPELSRIPVVFLTAIVSDKEVEAQKGNIGGRPFLAKPVTTQKLIECISQTLSQKQ
ncbi:MAG TPA: response regulator [Candidatus Omnitrophota bacterium]|nr:response regulator [Candidatus Omnitrophota bacterium]HRZ14121.1 response regulator [Candidatus Omnitrophota bacterium]